jgi:hypothetical protein
VNGIKVEVDLNELVVGTRWTGDPDDPTEERLDLVGVVIEEAARQIVVQVRNQATKNGVYDGLRERVQRIRDEEIRAAITPAIHEALTTALQPSDPYGQPKGEPKSLHEIVVEQAIKAIQTPVKDHYSRDSGLTPAQVFIRDEVRTAFTKELKAELDQAKADVLKAVRAEASKVMADTIARLAGVS